MENFYPEHSAGFITIFGLLLLGIVISGGSYLIIRPFVLWYLKIYSIVSELKENNALLRELIDELKEMNVQHSSSKPDTKDYSKYMPK